MSAITMGSKFPATLESELFSKVKGHSSLAKVSNQEALPFTGKDVFTFAFDSDISIVGEGGTKPAGDATLTTIQMRPIKVVYQMRTSEEFMYASEEYKLNILATFADGFAKKLGAGLDKMAIHGINPVDRVESTTIGNNCFDKAVASTNVVAYVPANADTNIDSAVALVEASEYAANGVVISPTMRGAISALTASGARKYPEFAFGSTPAGLGNMTLDTNVTVSTKSTVATKTDQAVVGDFKNCFRWGIAKQLPLEIIQYGNPDGQGDLKAANQVVLRSEAFIGWAIMDANAFALINA